MNILLWIIFGGIVGWIASMIVGKDAQMGIFANIVVGIVGAMIGGFLAGVFGIESVSGFNLYSFFIALVGAVILLGLVNAFAPRRRV